jgi:hypothetical protein
VLAAESLEKLQESFLPHSSNWFAKKFGGGRCAVTTERRRKFPTASNISRRHLNAGVNVDAAAPSPSHFFERRPAVGMCLALLGWQYEYMEDDVMTLTRGRIERLVMRVQSAFLENPMLSLTLPAAQRRFGVDNVTCAGVLGALVDARVLTQREGVYRRNCPRPALRPAA